MPCVLQKGCSPAAAPGGTRRAPRRRSTLRVTAAISVAVDDQLAAAEIEQPARWASSCRASAASTIIARLRRHRQQQQHEVATAASTSSVPLGRVDPLHVRERARPCACVPITRISSAAALRATSSADGAEAQDAQRLARQRLRHAARPLPLALVQRDAGM